MDAARDLRQDVARGGALDRDLARDLGRPAPADPGLDDASFVALDREAEERGTGPGAAMARGAEERGAEPGAAVANEAAAEERLVRAAQAGDAAARARLVEACLPRIATMSRTYRGGSVQQPELLQEGVVGVLRALERFDPDRGVPFWGYATWWVRQAMQQLVSELTRPVVLSDRALRRLAGLKDAHAGAVRDTGRAPGLDELAARAGVTSAQAAELMAVDRPARSLEEPVGDDALGSFGDLLVDPLAEGAYERVLDGLEAQEVHALLRGLGDRERTILRARYGLDGEPRTMREVGAQLGLSAERVRQLEQRALGKLAAVFAGEHTP